MANIQYSGGRSSDHGYEYGHEQQGAPAANDVSRATRLVNWAGAIVSTGLVIGMAIWSWQLLMRDVTEVPVIRALEGPMRIAPTDPGGSIAENQGLAVNRLAEGAVAAPVPDRLVLAPPPMDLDEAGPLEEAFGNNSEAELAEEPLPVVEQLPIEMDVDVDVDPAAETEALVARLVAEGQPLDPLLDDGVDLLVDATPEIVGRADTIPVSVPGVRISPRPAIRPAGLSARAPAPAGAAEAASADADADADADLGALDGVTETEDGFEIAAADLEDGTRLVQLGAFDTADLARAEWRRLSGVFPDFFLGRARVVEQASSGGQVFYRLRGHGFSDLSASRRFCAALVAQGAACIPVTVR